MIALNEEETEEKEIFDINEEYGITIRRSAYKDLWADRKGNIYKFSKHGSIFAPHTWVNNAGYVITNAITTDGKSTTAPVQRIVATAWIEQPKTDKRLVVDHKNDNKTDNRASNLRWVTYHTNLVKHHRMETMSGNNSYSRGRAVIKIYEDGQEKFYKSLSAAARDNDLSVTSIQGNCHHTLNLNRPFHFIFAK